MRLWLWVEIGRKKNRLGYRRLQPLSAISLEYNYGTCALSDGMRTEQLAYNNWLSATYPFLIG